MNVIDFTQFSDEKIVHFVNDNFEQFGSDKDEEFPANVLDYLARGYFSIIRQQKGFAIAYKGRRYSFGTGFQEADLMFLYVHPECSRMGLGTKLIEQVKISVTPDIPIILRCETRERKDFFGKRGFSVIEHYIEGDHYLMRWTPMNT
jgi:ribosomal protein S18 acetylase RimI-like enzyme